jgi:YbbR domain-containing protein
LADERFSLSSNLDIRLKFDLKASSPNLILRNIPIRYFAENSMVLSPIKSATLKLLIPDKMKNRHNVSSSIQVWADIPEGAKGKVEVPLKAIIPPGVHQLEIIPKTIIVNVP